MGIRGLDISNHQGRAGLDVEQVVRDNDLGFVFVLTNDGTVVNPYYQQQVDAARRAGALVLPYVYLRPNWAQTVDIHIEVAGPGTASIVDVEDGSGGWAEVWGAHTRLWDRGRATPLLYWPRFHWQSVGSPDLSPLAPHVRAHWKSWYADRAARAFDNALGLVPGYVWDDARGGIPVRVVQFTGTGRLAGFAGDLDLNYFPGSRAELAGLLGLEKGTEMSELTERQVDDVWNNLFEPAAAFAGQTLFGAVWANGDALVRVEANQAAHTAQLAAIAEHRDITPEELDRSTRTAVDNAVNGLTERLTQQLTTRMLAEVVPTLRQVLGEDNSDQARQVVDELTRRLGASTAAAIEGTRS